MPTLLARSLLRETTWLYLLGVATVCLLLSFDLLSVLARFLVQNNATVGEAATLLLYKVPWFLHLSLPISVVFAVLLAGGRMAKDSELKAAYSGGVPPAALLWPLVVFGVLVGIVSFANNAFLEARAEAAYQRMIDEFLYLRPPNELQIDAAYNLDEGIYFAARTRADPEDPGGVASLSGVLVVQQDGTTITSPEGEWDADDRIWRLHQSQTTEPGAAPTSTGTIELPFELEATPLQTLARPEELPFDKLLVQLRTVDRAGGDVSGLRYDLHRRIADAFSAAIFATFAGAIALRVRGREAGFAWTMVLMVLFWALWVLSGDLFTSGALGPISAAWLTPSAAAVGALVIAYRTLTR